MCEFYVWVQCVSSICEFYVWVLCASSACEFYVRVLFVSSMCDLCERILCVNYVSEFYVWVMSVNTLGANWGQPDKFAERICLGTQKTTGAQVLCASSACEFSWQTNWGPTEANQTSLPKYFWGNTEDYRSASSVCELCLRVLLADKLGANWSQPNKFTERNNFFGGPRETTRAQVLCASSACQFYWQRDAAHINPSQHKFAFQKELADRPPRRRHNCLISLRKAAGHNGTQMGHKSLQPPGAPISNQSIQPRQNP